MRLPHEGQIPRSTPDRCPLGNQSTILPAGTFGTRHLTQNRCPGGYQTHLEALSADELRDLVEKEKEKRAALEDAKLQFSEPLFRGGPHALGKFGMLDAPGGGSIVPGKEAGERGYVATLTDAAQICPLAKSYVRLRDRVLRAGRAGELADPVSPVKYVEWAHGNEIVLPEPLVSAVTRRFDMLKDNETLRKENRKLVEQVTQLEGLVAALKMSRSDESGDRPDRPLKRRERDSLHLIMLACAIKGYDTSLSSVVKRHC